MRDEAREGGEMDIVMSMAVGVVLALLGVAWWESVRNALFDSCLWIVDRSRIAVALIALIVVVLLALGWHQSASAAVIVGGGVVVIAAVVLLIVPLVRPVWVEQWRSR